MGKLLSDETAERLKRLLYGAGDQPIPQRRGGATTRAPVLVRCTSATAAGGAELGGTVTYPAKVVNINSLVSDQDEAADVWLSLLDGGTTASPLTYGTPVAGNCYYGLYAGTFDPFPSGSSDPRPKVFAVTRAAAGASLSVTAATGFSDFSITANDTWTNNGFGTQVLSLPSAGTYLITGKVTSQGQVSTSGGSNNIAIRLYDVTNAVELDNGTQRSRMIVNCPFLVNIISWQTRSISYITTITGAVDIQLEALRTSGTTWTIAKIWNSGGHDKTFLQAIKLF